MNASHVRTKRAAFSDASMSSVPASTCGWLPTMPTTWPSMRANPHTMFIAQSAFTSKNSPSSTTSAMTFFMSYGLFGASGMRSMMPSHERSGSSSDSKYGGSSRLFGGRNDSR